MTVTRMKSVLDIYSEFGCVFLKPVIHNVKFSFYLHVRKKRLKFVCILTTFNTYIYIYIYIYIYTHTHTHTQTHMISWHEHGDVILKWRKRVCQFLNLQIFVSLLYISEFSTCWRRWLAPLYRLLTSQRYYGLTNVNPECNFNLLLHGAK
jgi:hypothetical protein